MTILELLARITGIPGDRLRAMLVAGKVAVPDLAPTIDEKLALLDAALSESTMVTLAAIIKDELPNIFRGQFSGKPRPSDLV